MSLLFFHDGLSQAEGRVRQVVRGGGPKGEVDFKTLEEASRIIRLHMGLQGTTREGTKEFTKMITNARLYLKELNAALENLEKNPKYSIKCIVRAREYGVEIVKWAEHVTRLCKKEELEVEY